MFCPKCGAQNADQSVFCANCGNALAAPVQPVQQPIPQPTPAKAPMGKGILTSIIISSVVILASIVVLLITLLGGGEEKKDTGKKPSTTKQNGRVTQSTDSGDDKNDTNPSNDDDDGDLDLDFDDLFGGDAAVDGTPATEAVDVPVEAPVTEPTMEESLRNGSEDLSDIIRWVIEYWNEANEDFFWLTMPKDLIEPAVEMLYSGDVQDWIREELETEANFHDWLENVDGIASYLYQGDREAVEMFGKIASAYDGLLDCKIEDVRVIETERRWEYYQMGSYQSENMLVTLYVVRIDGIWYLDILQWLDLY